MVPLESSHVSASSLVGQIFILRVGRAVRLRFSAVKDATDRSVGLRSSLFHRPSPAANTLPRPDLLTRLDNGAQQSLTLVSAPAGFGKSNLVSQWCDTQDRPCVWLSMDPSIDELRWFLVNLTAAITAVCPGSLRTTSQMTRSAELPPERALLAELANELEELDQQIVIVLDDYYLISSRAVHTLMSELLRHPPAMVRFVMITRQDPPLPLAALRAKGQVCDVRMGELAFSSDETKQFVERELGRHLPPSQQRALYSSTEGWPAGLRLAIEAIRLVPKGSAVVGVGFLDAATQEYLTAEVMGNLPSDVRRYLLTASLFDQFDAGVCDVTVGNVMPGPIMMTGAEFIEWLSIHNLFVIPLDAEGRWFRFHHLFQRLLEHWRTERGIALELSAMEARQSAARYFEGEGLVELALDQLVKAQDHGSLALLAARYGDELVNEERWADLERLLNSVPATVTDADPAILVLWAWVVGEVHSRHREMLDLLARAEAYLDQGAVQDQKKEDHLRGQMLVLRGAYDKHLTADFEGTIEDARNARALLADAPGRNLAFAYVLGAVALAGAGRTAEAYRLAHSIVGDQRFADAPFNPLVFAMPYLGWLEGDLDEVERYSTQLATIGERFDLDDTTATAHYFLGMAAYERNQLAEADEHLSAGLDLRYASASALWVQSSMALALSSAAQGRTDEAGEIAGTMMQWVVDLHSEFHLPVARGFLAELDLRCGRLVSAFEWAMTAEVDPARHRYMFYEPTPTIIEALLSSPETTPRAVELLASSLEGATRRHHTPLSIRLLGIHAVHMAQTGNDAQALEALETAVVRSHKAGMVRRLADLGPALIPLIPRLQLDREVLAHAAKILDAIGSATPDPQHYATRGHGIGSVNGEPTLTGREREVLELLAERLSNKEIARELLIAPATVKKRTVTLYGKLNVHGRREAVAKARALGYLQDAGSGVTPHRHSGDKP